MNRTEKEQVIKDLSSSFKEAQAVIVCDYKGLSVAHLEHLRLNVRSINGKVQVAKNTLAQIAFKKAGIDELELVDTNIFVWGDDQINLSKVVSKFANDHELLVIKQAVIENEIKDAAMVQALSKLPNREELLGMLLSVWTAPARHFVTGVDNLRAQKEQEA